MSLQKALFAAGCFWGVQFYFDQVPGVQKTTAGYTGGHTKNPSYDEVVTHTTGHAEAVLVEFDPSKITYETLVRHFFRIHNPTLLDTDGINVGNNYRSALFYFGAEQKQIAEKVKGEVQAGLKDPIVTDFIEASTFYPAETYHQKFTERTGIGMCHVPYKEI